jgi:phospholipid transport system transporter-binding protein
VPAVLVDSGAGRCTVAGDLTLATAGQLWRQLHSSGLLRSAGSVDLGGVKDSDSAGLALLMAWRACCRASGHDLKVLALPERLAALARLTAADGFLSG